MDVFLVGGAVRDELLDLPVVERDWVVVGATPAQMLAEGYRQPDMAFPVFRHPETGEEYALARRETKQGAGYRGFSIDVDPGITLDEDLKRRDLTINAMARGDDGTLVDPYGGRDDLDAGLLRHVSPAFSEDPLRVLRIARFAAKLGQFGFRVAHATHRLMVAMVKAGAMDELPAERVWRETRNALATECPWRFFEVLQSCGALEQLLPALSDAMGASPAHGIAETNKPLDALKRMAQHSPDPTQRLLALMWLVATDRDTVESILKQLPMDRSTARLLRRIADAHPHWLAIADGDVNAMAQLAKDWLGIDPAQREALMDACTAQSVNDELVARLNTAIDAGDHVDAATLRERGLEGAALGEAVEAARLAAIKAALQLRVTDH